MAEKDTSQSGSPADAQGFDELMRKSQDGDKAAYAQLLGEILNPIRGFIRKHYPGIRDIEDVLQESLITLHKVRHTYDPSRPFLPWMFALVRYRSLDYLRKHIRIQSREVANDDMLESMFAAKTDTADEDREAALAMLEGVSDKEREVIELLKIEQLSVKDVAKQLGLSESNVKVIASRGYAKLRRKLKDSR